MGWQKQGNVEKIFKKDEKERNLKINKTKNMQNTHARMFEGWVNG